MKSRTSIAMLAFLLLGLLNLAVGGPISEDVADALIVERTGQHYGSYDWEFELFREDNCGQLNNGSVVFHGYGSKGCAAEGGALGFYSVKVSRIAPGCEVVFYDQPTCTQDTAGVPDSKVPKLDEHTLVDACLDRGHPTRGFEINCPAPALVKRASPWELGPGPGTGGSNRYEFTAYWPSDCTVSPPTDPEYTQKGATGTGCEHFAGVGVNGFKLKYIDAGCRIILSDDPSCGPNGGGPDPKLDVMDSSTKTDTCLGRENRAKAYTVVCDDAKVKRASPWELGPGPGNPTKPSQDYAWNLELFSDKDCNTNNGPSQGYSGMDTKPCTEYGTGFDAVKITSLKNGCSVDFFHEATCPNPALLTIGTRPDPPINTCFPMPNGRGQAFSIKCTGTDVLPENPPAKREGTPTSPDKRSPSKVDLPGYQGPPPTPQVDAPEIYSFDLFEDQSCIPSTISEPGHFQQHFGGPGDTIDCQQNGWTGNGFRGIMINKIEDPCVVTFYSDNFCTSPVNNFHSNDPVNSCRQFTDAPGHPLTNVKSFVIRGCKFP